MTVTPWPFIFWCKHCNAVRRIPDDQRDYRGEVNGYYETRCICPECKRKLVFREKSVLTYIKEQKLGTGN